jgi:AcrR family transcriptional regulator
MPQVKRRTAQRPRDPLATRAALVEAAADIFRAEGYFATDTNAIARRAGYAPASFYKHFPDKTAILLAVYERYADLEWQGVRDEQARKPEQRIKAVLAFLERLHRDWARFRTDLRTVARMDAAVAGALAHSRKRQLKMMSELTGQSSGRQVAAHLLTLKMMENYADALAEAGALGIASTAVRAAMARLLTALLPA